MISPSQKTEFQKIMEPPYDALDMAIGWIQDNLNPEEVFSDHDLETWAFENGFQKFD